MNVMIKIFETHEHKVFKSHLINMVKMAKSDGEFHRKERDFIRRIGLEHGLENVEIDNIMFHTGSYEIELPKSKKLRFFQLVDFVELMMEDGQVCDKERCLFQLIVDQLGFNRVYAGIILEKIERGLEETKNKRQIYFLCYHLID